MPDDLLEPFDKRVNFAERRINIRRHTETFAIFVSDRRDDDTSCFPHVRRNGCRLYTFQYCLVELVFADADGPI